MISLSNLLKSHLLVGEEVRVLSAKTPPNQTSHATSAKPNQQESEEVLQEAKDNLTLEIAQLQKEYERIQGKWQEEELAFKNGLEQLRKEEQQKIGIEAEAKWEQAQQEGFQQGYDEVIQKLEQEYQQKKEQLSEITKSAYQEKEKIVFEAEYTILELSISIAERILQAELEISLDKIVPMIQEALKEVSERGDITIQVSPQAYTALQAHMDELKMYVDSNSNLKLIADYKYQGPGCMIHTPNGSYDVIIDHQLEEIKKHLLDFAKERAPE